ncbi:hypothetical protein L596_008198 [Steinernema carpocapsae]|uniref:HECT domain-containing protein n=1 Tax=Steinernema carpocapsae TaxID=34508 RepID=A0A4U5PBU3_STECR|nr:hypothetical protein L596_008198 [Steinernema carpocapsae]
MTSRDVLLLPRIHDDGLMFAFLGEQAARMGKRCLYAWGLAEEGQLGMRIPGSGLITSPQQIFGAPVDEFGVTISSIACGEKHTIMLTADGKLWSVGANECGQLGRSGAQHGSFTIYPVEMNVGTKIIQIEAGQYHSAAVAEDGRLFVWGRNAELQCARRNSNVVNKPSRVTEITEAVQVACGANNCVALQQSGNVYVWGAVLGKHVSLPTIVSIFSKIPIVQISAGDDHFGALTSSGYLYTWGRNEYGQCGNGSQLDRPHLLRQQPHGGTHEGRPPLRADPQLVAELLGSHVTKVACGRLHTVAVASGRIYSFGLNSNGQLGTGRLSSTIITPQLVCELNKITTIFAGYDQTFAIEAPITDLMSSPSASLETPKFLSMSRLRQLFADGSDNKLDIMGELESVFSSMACFNGSFAYTDDRRFHCSASNIAMNLDDAMYTFNMIANHQDADRFGEIIVDCLKMGVFEGNDHFIFNQCSPRENAEVCKFLMALPWFHEMVHPEKDDRYDSLFMPYVKLLTAVNRLTGTKLLRRWWTGLATRHFNKIVQVLMAGVEYQVAEKKDNMDMVTVLKLLKQLYDLSQQFSKIPADHFYLNSLMKKMDIRSDFFHWITDGSSREDDELLKPFHFVDYPFLFNAEAKAALLEAEAQFSMYRAAQEPSMAMIPFYGVTPVMNPTFNIEVRRNNIVEDTISVFSHSNQKNFMKPLRVKFVGEEGQDEGGVRKEFFMLLFQQLLQSHYGMFIEDPDSHYVWFSGIDLGEQENFKLVGRLCALAVYNAILVDFPFPLALYKKLLGHKLTLDDLMMLHPTEGRSLQALMDYEETDEEDVFALSFQISIDVWGQAVDVELKPGGKDIPVTHENKAEFVRLYVERRLELGVNEQVKNQIGQFISGFKSVMTSKIIDFFQPHELMELIVGNENYDWEIFKKNTQYKGEYNKDHPAVKAFWDAFFELDVDQRKKFLLFLMGSARIPVGGMEKLAIVVQPIPDHLYPVAHTCFNLLDLPNLADKKEMKRRLQMCIEHTEGFTLV